MPSPFDRSNAVPIKSRNQVSPLWNIIPSDLRKKETCMLTSLIAPGKGRTRIAGSSTWQIEIPWYLVKLLCIIGSVQQVQERLFMKLNRARIDWVDVHESMEFLDFDHI